MSGNLTTLANALQWLGQSSDPQDMVARLVEATSTKIQKWLGYQILQASYTRTFDGQGLPKLFVPDLPLVSVESLVINGETIPQGSWSSSTQQPGYYHNASSIALVGYCFRCGFQNITATYTAGYETVPDDIEQACLDWMKASWANFQVPGVGVNAKALRAGDNAIEFGGEGDSTDIKMIPMPSSVLAALKPYQRKAMISGL